MATTAVSNPSPVNGGESKASRRKKAKDGSVSGSAPSPAVPDGPGKEDSSLEAKGDGDVGAYEHPYIKELAKHIRNTHKKLSGMQKVDAVIAENPDSSLDELVAQRKINADQKAAALKKPQLQQQLATFEEQISQYRKFDAEYQTQLQKQKDDLTSQHQKELEKAKDELKLEGVTAGAAELRKKLLVFSQFLRAAAAKRTVEEEADTDESRAFEGALLLVYGGDQNAVETAVKLIEGSEEQVPSIEGVSLPVKCKSAFRFVGVSRACRVLARQLQPQDPANRFADSQVKQASIDHAPFQAEETWVDSVAEANATPAETAPVSDPTIAHAGLTELDTSAQPNGVSAEAGTDTITSPPQADAGDETGNAAGDRWDTTAAGAEKPPMDDSFEMIPRPQDEVETPASAVPEAAPQEKSMSWADEPPAYDAGPSGNLAGESWDIKAAGEQSDNAWAGPDATAQASSNSWADGATDAATGAVQEDGDGFHPVPGRNRGRGGRGRGGDGEFRGRGRGRGGFRGDGEFRGRGRGGFRGGRGEGGEFRGRGGRGRGPRGGVEGQQSRGS